MGFFFATYIGFNAFVLLFMQNDSWIDKMARGEYDEQAGEIEDK